MADISITAANVLKGSSASVMDGTSGDTITAGHAVYVNTNDSNKIYRADADGTSPSASPAGIALHAALAGQPIRYVTEDPAFTFGGTVAIGDTIFLSDTPGGLTLAGAQLASPELESGDTIVVMGVAVTTTTVNLRIVIGGTRTA